MLTVEKLTAGYGNDPVVKQVTLNVGPGECVALIGANGAGKSTLLKAIMGIVEVDSGSVAVRGTDVTATSTHKMHAHGLSYVPEGRELFPALSVEDNLQVAAVASRRRWSRDELAEAYSMFPILGERRQQLAGHLSGGQQQMLAMARGLIVRPDVWLLDEPSLGLAPVIADDLFARIDELGRQRSLATLLVEQNAARALEIADRIYVMELGVIVASGTPSAIAQNKQVWDAYIGAAGPTAPTSINEHDDLEGLA